MLHTERLALREFTPDDADFIYRLLNSPGWLKYIGTRNIDSLDDARAYIANKLSPSYKQNGFGFYIAELKDTSSAVGMCGLAKREALDDVDLGFALLPEFEGKGYAYEASVEVIKFAKESIGLNKLAALTVHYNVPSIKLLEKLGMEFEKNIRMPGDEEKLMLYGKLL